MLLIIQIYNMGINLWIFKATNFMTEQLYWLFIILSTKGLVIIRKNISWVTKTIFFVDLTFVVSYRIHSYCHFIPLIHCREYFPYIIHTVVNKDFSNSKAAARGKVWPLCIVENMCVCVYIFPRTTGSTLTRSKSITRILHRYAASGTTKKMRIIA